MKFEYNSCLTEYCYSLQSEHFEQIILLTVTKVAFSGILYDLKVQIRALLKSVMISGTIRIKNKLQIQTILSGSSYWKTAKYFLSLSRPGIPWLQSETVRFVLIMEVINNTMPFDKTAHDRITKNVIIYVMILRNLSIISIHLELNVSSSSSLGVTTKTSHPFVCSFMLLNI
jgi:hypothetical protein